MKPERILIVLSALLLAALACQAGGAPIAVTLPAAPVATLPPVSVSAPAANPAAQQDVLVNLYQQVSPGIVAIKVVGPQGASLGSGFVYDTDGHIVTNFHV